jgi:subtilase family serine protease
VWFPAPPGFWFFGGGGGTSIAYAQPAWQKNIVPSALANINHPTVNAPARVVPDVSMVGDPVTGFLVGQSDPNTGVYAEAAIGGTSLSTPLFAGVVALAQQNLGRGKHFGLLNPTLYKAAKKGAFRDVLPFTQKIAAVPVAGVVTTFDTEATMSIHVTPGYDNITGLGVPDGKAFLKAVK